jgi:hypothetical protein
MVRIGILCLAALGIAAEAAAAPPAAGLAPGARNRVTGELCDPARTVQAERRESPRLRKLGELPPGNVVLTVVREVGGGGCAAPVIVRYGVGGGADGAKAAPKVKRPL